MKNLKTLFTVAALCIAFMGCKKSESSTTVSIIQQGTWRVTLFSEDGTDETSMFTGYNFTFTSAGTVTAINGASVITGTWSAGTDDSQQKLILSFTAIPFDELSSDWHIIERTSTRFRLEDTSGGSGTTDYLTFEKN